MSNWVLCSVALYILGMFPMYGLLLLYEDHPQNQRRHTDQKRLTTEQMIICSLLWPIAGILMLAVKGNKPV